MVRYLIPFLVSAIFFPETEVNAKTLEFKNEVDCFAMAIFYESRSEILTAQVAVSEALLTRMKSTDFYPDTACANVTKKSWSKKKRVYICAFEWFCSDRVVLDLRKRAERRAWNQSVSLAKMFLSKKPPSLSGFENVSLFHDESKFPWWSKMPNVKLVAKIGKLYFYEEKRNGVLIAKL